MTYTEAVELAKAGEERGFGYLYANTQESKYYLALQYMKDEELAKDVLQDAYLKAFTNLDKLQQPEAFPGWLGTIVANTAKNMLAKKKPLLFSDIAVDSDNESFEYQIEDDDWEAQPELAYTRKETQELVHEMLASLSDDQRFCILMFHIEGMSISDIAAAMNCSENTVKSRLNYGRKNLKTKAEELQKKGYKLYSVSPLPLLLFLLRSEEQAMRAEGALLSVAGEISQVVFSQPSGMIPGAGNTPGTGAANAPDFQNGTGNTFSGNNMASGVNTGVKNGLLHTTSAKIATIAVVGLVTIGAIFYGVTHNETPDNQWVENEWTTQNDTTGSTTKTPYETQSATPTNTPDAATEKEVDDNDYSTLIEGNLNKDELEFVLAYGPEELSEQGLDDMDILDCLANFCQDEDYVTMYGSYNGGDGILYSLKDINRLFSSFTDFQYTKENISTVRGGITINGNKLAFCPPTLSYERTAHITSASYTPEEMTIYYTFEHMSYEEGTTTYQKKAVLLPLENGKYRIHTIEIVTDEQDSPSESESASETDTTSIKELYEGVLQSVKNHKSGYEIGDDNSTNGTYSYFVADLDGDGIEELAVGKETSVDKDDVLLGNVFRVFSCKKKNGKYQVIPIKGSYTAGELHISADGNGLYLVEFSRSSWDDTVYQITIKSGKLVRDNSPKMEFKADSEEAQQFRAKNPAANWFDISDLSGLNGL